MPSDKMKNALLKHHGLAPDCKDEEVTEAMKNSYSADDIEDMENRAEVGDKAQASLIDADLDKYKNRIGTGDKAREHWKAVLLSNRDAGIEMLEAIPEPIATVISANGGKEPLHNRSKAGTPKPVDQEAADVTKETARAQKVANRARELQALPAFQNRHRAAFDQAESEFPKAA